jgi:hypothetical protein
MTVASIAAPHARRNSAQIVLFRMDITCEMGQVSSYLANRGSSRRTCRDLRQPVRRR